MRLFISYECMGLRWWKEEGYNPYLIHFVANISGKWTAMLIDSPSVIYIRATATYPYTTDSTLYVQPSQSGEESILLRLACMKEHVTVLLPTCIQRTICSLMQVLILQLIGIMNYLGPIYYIISRNQRRPSCMTCGLVLSLNT